jgi:hypothetical protein
MGRAEQWESLKRMECKQCVKAVTGNRLNEESRVEPKDNSKAS